MQIFSGLFGFFLLFANSFSIPLGQDGVSVGERHTNAKVHYKEKINSNTSTAEVVMTFSKIAKTQPVVKQNNRIVPEANATISTSNGNKTIQSDSIIDLNKTIDIPISTSEHLENPDNSQEDQQSELFDADSEEDEETLFHFRGPGYGRPPPPLQSTTAVPAITDEDRKAREDWGGDCLSADWKRCNKIDGWGGNYYIKDKKNPGKFILKTDGKIPCVSSPRTKEKDREKSYCLKNGFTVARCHMLCMSECNNDYRIEYDKLVQYEGDCANPLTKG